MSKTASTGSRLSSRHRILRWVVTLCWAALIFDFSTSKFGSSFTGVMLARWLAAIHIHLSPGHFEILHLIVRKGAHFTEYGILSLLLYASISSLKRFEWQPRVALLCVLIAAFYSLTDEFHQTFVPDRGPSLEDCAVDVSGAVIAMLLVYLGTRWASKRRAGEVIVEVE
ncbi:MAG TPA: VanZ family protein [Terriglobia bacterium]|nr:VanZ family protein [Terriglobia bacterium]